MTVRRRFLLTSLCAAGASLATVLSTGWRGGGVGPPVAATTQPPPPGDEGDGCRGGWD
eukprot:gene45802-25841_t